MKKAHLPEKSVLFVCARLAGAKSGKKLGQRLSTALNAVQASAH